ncbi:carbon-nitrogen hydrolase family protein [Celerinatantimonas diazotrophica]|uniref:Nitrilase n=1 Tax=Celerinatantimonas diazotrophica TaxID=412034 RepID=A0A4R1J8M9_9GAMM|nr:carbon-nitrogen hydrolase family protein [Celerinatantimonas diazotrophica]TCK46717.1 nitrilase [Celerinatantimonas diazotrophica]CAG9295419.1 Deaminated glutathione amidase [Celerinatantimonas diazotrophica]
MTQPTLIAAIQLNSGDDVAANLSLASDWVGQAASLGARYVVLPEYFYWMGEDEMQRVDLGEPFGHGPLQQAMSNLAKRHQIYLAAGTLPIVSPLANHVYNSQLLFGPQGDCLSRYDKIHLFGFDDGTLRYQESDVLASGRQVTDYNLDFARVRTSICYDLRFPELYRHPGAYELISMAAAFTYPTGQAHWHTLLQARAIENQCYLVASAQTGTHPGGKQTFGHSLIIDPWGTILDECVSGNGMAIAEFNLEHLTQIRQKLPALSHRVL